MVYMLSRHLKFLNDTTSCTSLNVIKQNFNCKIDHLYFT